MIMEQANTLACLPEENREAYSMMQHRLNKHDLGNKKKSKSGTHQQNYSFQNGGRIQTNVEYITD